MSHNFKMVATTMFGLEEVLATELKNLGAQDVEAGVRNVSFTGDKGFMYKANIALRTAIRILKPIKKFKVFDEDDLYKKLQTIDWERIMNVDSTFAIGAVVNSKNFTTNSHYISLKSKDAIADYFRHKYHKRPNVDIKYPDVKIHVHILNDLCTVSLDSSGDSLHKRGYRSATNIAPINEVLAAGLVLLSGYTGDCNFIDPMCGSGTILIEAAMIACNIPANINRKEFAFEKWNDWDNDLFDQIVDSLLKRTREFHHTIKGYDKAPSAVNKAKDNISNANLSEYISIEQKNFFDTQKETTGPLQMLFNPPYGERLDIELERFYREIGDTMKQNYPGTNAWFITGNLEALKFVGLKPSRKIKLFNGSLEARLVKYEMYEGSKKVKYMNREEV